MGQERPDRALVVLHSKNERQGKALMVERGVGERRMIGRGGHLFGAHQDAAPTRPGPTLFDWRWFRDLLSTKLLEGCS